MKINKRYDLLPHPQKIVYKDETFEINNSDFKIFSNSSSLGEKIRNSNTFNTQKIEVESKKEENTFFLKIEKVKQSKETFERFDIPVHLQGYLISVEPDYVYIASKSEMGLFYGWCTLKQILNQSDNAIRCLTISDWPILDNRGLMLDISRGRVYTLDYLKKLVTTIASMKINVLQLYIEHTFEFSFLSSVHEGSSPITAQEIQALDKWCRDNHVELQANLQSFGHCNRLLTTKGYRHLRESNLYWTLSPSVEESYTLLDKMYEEFLPNFSSPILNVDSDETYDLGSGKSESLMREIGQGPLYLKHLLRLRELAKKQGKQLMVFGDVILNHPELLKEIPEDIIFLDWMYDPLEEYKTPSKFAEAKRTFWVCPGTGAWNTLFPRQEGAYKNIMDFTIEGISKGAEGSLLCDWGDHGNYGMPFFSYFSYAVASQAGWEGKDRGHEYISKTFASLIGEASLEKLHTLLPSIHRLPALWSKNRSQCVIALFDEPLQGRMLTFPLPPKDLEYFKALPKGVEGVLDKESHHLMRPLFALSPKTLSSIKNIAEEARPLVDKLSDISLKAQYGLLIDALFILSDKVSLGRNIREHFISHNVTPDLILDWEREIRLLINRYSLLQIDFIDIWRTFAKTSEISITLTYFAHIIERLDYLKSWLLLQREALETNKEVDYCFATYETAGYKSLPTY